MQQVTVLQSHQSPLPHTWLDPCVESVKNWALHCGYHYRWLDDELFDVLDPVMRERTSNQRVVASDLARLMWCERLLAEGDDVVIWCDADVLMPWPDRFQLTINRNDCGVGREHWVKEAKPDGASTPKVYRKVHNAFMWFGHGSTFLPFYRESAAKLLQQHAGPWVSQFIGPKLLTALHNIVGLPVIECAAVMSPAVIRDILKRHQVGHTLESITSGAALAAWVGAATEAPLAVNLCASSVRNGHIDDAQMTALCALLQSERCMPGFDA